jgi:hypothetical protein
MIDFALLGMDQFKIWEMRIEKVLSTEDGVGKLSNTANLIAILEKSLEFTTNKLLQKD